MGEHIRGLWDEASGKTFDGGVCERHLEEHLCECNGKDGSGRMRLGRTEKTIGRGASGSWKETSVRTHIEKNKSAGNALQTPGAIGMFYFRKVPNFGWNATICFVMVFTIRSHGLHSPSSCSTVTFGDPPLGCSEAAAAAARPRRHYRQRISHPIKTK